MPPPARHGYSFSHTPAVCRRQEEAHCHCADNGDAFAATISHTSLVTATEQDNNNNNIAPAPPPQEQTIHSNRNWGPRHKWQHNDTQ